MASRTEWGARPPNLGRGPPQAQPTARPLAVIEGAAGAGKTTTLAAAATLLDMHGQQLVVAAPTLKAAQVAATELGAPAFSAAWLIHQHGYRWDDDGHWTRYRVNPQDIDAGARLFRGDLLLIDEAGMLDHAARWADPDNQVTLDAVHRFTDPEYAHLTLKMRTGTDAARVFDALLEGGHVVIHASDVERRAAAADLAAAAPGDLVIADTRDQVTALNAAIVTNNARQRATSMNRKLSPPSPATASPWVTGSLPAATTADSTSPTATNGPSPP